MFWFLKSSLKVLKICSFLEHLKYQVFKLRVLFQVSFIHYLHIMAYDSWWYKAKLML